MKNAIWTTMFLGRVFVCGLCLLAMAANVAVAKASEQTGERSRSQTNDADSPRGNRQQPPAPPTATTPRVTPQPSPQKPSPSRIAPPTPNHPPHPPHTPPHTPQSSHHSPHHPPHPPMPHHPPLVHGEWVLIETREFNHHCAHHHPSDDCIDKRTNVFAKSSWSITQTARHCDVHRHSNCSGGKATIFAAGGIPPSRIAGEQIVALKQSISLIGNSCFNTVAYVGAVIDEPNVEPGSATRSKIDFSNQQRQTFLTLVQNGARGEKARPSFLFATTYAQMPRGIHIGERKGIFSYCSDSEIRIGTAYIYEWRPVVKSINITVPRSRNL